MKAMKAKIFSYCTADINPPTEVQINAWLEENPKIDIVQILQSESMAAFDNRVERNLSITILYR